MKTNQSSNRNLETVNYLISNGYNPGCEPVTITLEQWHNAKNNQHAFSIDGELCILVLAGRGTSLLPAEIVGLSKDERERDIAALNFVFHPTAAATE
jgi:hypothetical protein